MKKSTTTRADAYVRVPDFADRLAGVRFPPGIWAVFAQCDAPRTPAEIARRANLDETEVASVLRRLARKRLVQKHELDWQSYLGATAPAAAAVAAAPAVQSPSLITITIPAPAPSAAIPAAPAAPTHVEETPAPSTPLCFSLGNERRALDRQAAARDVVAFSIGGSRAPRPGSMLAA